jgi:hypothetical protein
MPGKTAKSAAQQPFELPQSSVSSTCLARTRENRKNSCQLESHPGNTGLSMSKGGLRRKPKLPWSRRVCCSNKPRRSERHPKTRCYCSQSSSGDAFWRGRAKADLRGNFRTAGKVTKLVKRFIRPHVP